MRCRPFLLSLCLALSVASAAMAQSYADDLVKQLSGQGYADISVETTFLGRVRIVAQGEGGHREIILNPRTGEILRDLWIAAGGAAPKVTIVDHSSSGSGTGRDDGGDDNSGSGSGDDDDNSGGDDDNSGSGSGDDNSGSGSDDDDNGGDDDNSGSGSGGDGRDDDRNDDRDRDND